MIACSLLERAGYNNVVNVSGGFAAWQKLHYQWKLERLSKGELKQPFRSYKPGSSLLPAKITQGARN